MVMKLSEGCQECIQKEKECGSMLLTQHPSQAVLEDPLAHHLYIYIEARELKPGYSHKSLISLKQEVVVFWCKPELPLGSQKHT